MKCLCGGEMRYQNSPSWVEDLVCDKCGSKLQICFQDLMSGALISKSYEWRTSTGEFVISYDETIEGERINIKEEE